VVYSDIQGGFGGEGNIDADPLFTDSANGDYRLLPCSPAIDAGDRVERLRQAYTAGSTGVLVDLVTHLGAGDLIWITDGGQSEGDTVASATVDTINLDTGYMDAYAPSPDVFLFTFTSDFRDEPAPNGWRINMGAHGGGENSAASVVCRANIEGDDDDVDGSDLDLFTAAFGASAGDAGFNPDADLNDNGTVDYFDLFMLAKEFGRIGCPVCP
jgi:hypothetical protein